MHPELTKNILTDKENNSVKVTLLYSLKKWMNIRPNEAIECWRCVLNTSEQLFEHIIRIIDEFSLWETEGINEILKILLNLERHNIYDRLLGKAVSKYVDATNKGDDLLWQYIAQDVPVDNISYNFFHSHDMGLNCSEHHFYRKYFIRNRFKKSILLLEEALNALNDWGLRYEYYYNKDRLNNCFLRDTFWQQKHHDYEHHFVSPINELLNGIHQALIFYAKEKSDWFLKTEPVFRKTRDGATAYFLIYSYLTNPEVYADRAYGFLLRPEILFESMPSDEIGEIIKEIIPYLLPEQQDIIQKTIIERKRPDWEPEENPIWLSVWKYKQLSVIPKIFRSSETQIFIEKWQDTFGLYPKPPETWGWGGTIGSPISAAEMENLSLNGLIKLFKFYGDETSRGGWHDPSDYSKGGIDQITSEFSRCVEKNPQKYIQYMDTLWESGVSNRYIYSLLRGVSNHIDYRFGRLQKPPEIEFREPIVNGETLADVILAWFDKYHQIMEDGHESSAALYVISYVVERDDLQERLIAYYEKMSRHHDPEKIKQIIFSQDKIELDKDDLLHIAINSVRGRIADGVTTLIQRLLEKEKEIPEKLYTLLEQFAVDPVESVRIHVLELLPFLEYKKSGKGWNLFKKIFENAHPSLWPHGYRFLYYQYRENFNLVNPVLERIKNNGGRHGAEPWGLISALCVLNDFITLKSLISQLKEFNQENAWDGAIKVFTTNLKSHDLRNKCLTGLIALLKEHAFPINLVNNIERIFEEIPVIEDELLREFLDLFIDKIPLKENIHSLKDFFDYLSKLFNIYPEWCIELVERFLKKSPTKKTAYMWGTEGLIIAAIQLLKWADIEDSQDLIIRVINIQDRLLELECHGIEEALHKAERE